MRCQLKVALIILTALICPAVSFATVSVSISPSTVEVQPGGQAQFNAVVSGANSVVVWSLTGVSCSGVACGQISNTGLYQSPTTAPNPNVITVTATVLSDLSVTASAAAIVGSSSDVKVAVSPTEATVLVGQQQQFVSFVSGTTITGVTWHLSGGSCAGSGCGTISAAGVYTAPATLPTPAQVTVTATSIADPSKSGSGVVTVALPVAVNVSPTSVTLNTGMQKQFTATSCEYHEQRCDMESCRQRLQRAKLRNDHKYRFLYRTIISAKPSPGHCVGNLGGRSHQDQHSDGYDHSASSCLRCADDSADSHRRPSAIHCDGHEYDEQRHQLECFRERVQRIGLRNCHFRRVLHCPGHGSYTRPGLCDSNIGSGSHEIQHGLGDDHSAGGDIHFTYDCPGGYRN